MLTLALMVALGQMGEPCYRVPRAGHGCGMRATGRSGTDWAYFEAFPVGGAGAGLVAPYPNWILQSEDFATSWSLNFSAGKAGTITANYALSPIGDMTADRLQLPQVTAPGEYSRILQGSWSPAFGNTATWTCSVMVKGNGTSGNFPMYLLTSFPSQTATCTYTASDWAECSITGTVTASSENFYLGGSGAGVLVTLAQDVLLWGAMCNPGTTRATYVKTTTVAKGYTPTGARGETLAFARASLAMATATAGGGFATTGIVPGDLRLMPSNQPRTVFNQAGVVGLLEEQAAATNSCTQSEAIDNASWNNGFSGAAAPTLNSANAAASPSGSVTAEDYTFPATSAAQLSFRYSAVVVTTAIPWTASIFVEGVSTGGTTDLCIDSNTVKTCTPCVVPVLGTYSRCTLTVTAGVGNTFLYIGNASAYNGGTARNAVRAYVWGAMLEAGSVASSYTPTTTVAVARAAETASFAKSIPTSAGVCTAATVEVPTTAGFTAGSGLYAPGLSSVAGSFASPYLWPYTGGAGTAMSIDGTGSAAAPTGFAGAQVTSTFSRYIASNTGALWRICKDATCTTGATGAWSSPTYAHVKLSQPGTQGPMIWTEIQADPTWSRCR